MKNSVVNFELISEILRPRDKQSHKGTYGHALLIAGSYGKMGAAILAAKACLRSGVGLLTVHVPSSGVSIIQTAIPEAMVSADSDTTHVSDVISTEKFGAVGIGPGLGLAPETQAAFHSLIKNCTKPTIIDADGLNCLSIQKSGLNELSPHTILTPHPLEFERLTGGWKTIMERTKKQLAFSEKFNCIVILKDYETLISMPDGSIYQNTTGNPGMAKGGTGDALTGIITAFLAQGYSSKESSLISVFIHGMAGEFAAEKKSTYAMLSGDLIENLPNVFLKF